MQDYSVDTVSKDQFHHPIWYRNNGTDIFLVEKTLFKLARNILVTHSQVFADIMMPQNHETQTTDPSSLISLQVAQDANITEGQSDLNPIRLPQVTTMEFEYMVDLMYNSQWKMPPFPFEQLVAVLKLSSIYLVVPEREWAIHWLTLETLHPAVRIQLAYLYDIEEWIEPAFRILLSCRLKTLSIEDTYHLGP
ncbi:hypothetical protein K439DRAFT_1611267 [Ramaria rubella]|nr:hypothetical protein K439DRAFT_1611267 [Ramaria rubella]